MADLLLGGVCTGKGIVWNLDADCWDEVERDTLGEDYTLARRGLLTLVECVSRRLLTSNIEPIVGIGQMVLRRIPKGWGNTPVMEAGSDALGRGGV